MSLATRISDLATRMSTEAKSLRTLINGNVADNTALTTTVKTNLVAAINEVNAKPNSGSLASLTDTTITTPATGHVIRYNAATSKWENVLGTAHFDTSGAAAGAQAFAIQRANHTGTQSADTIVDSATKATFLITERTKLTGIAAGATANATDAQLRDRATHTGTQSADTLLDGTTNKAFLATERTKLSGIATGATVNDTDANLRNRANHTGTQAAGTITGLGYFATGTDAANLTGTLGTAQLPSLAINDTFSVASQAAMLALTAQRGDMAIRTDLGKMFVLTTDAPTVLANWTQLTATGDVISVAGRTGTVVLAKADVGLSLVDNTADASKPVSTAQQTALNGKQNLDATLTGLAGTTVAANQIFLASGADTFTAFTTGATGRALLGDATAADARTEIDVYSKAEIGVPETDFVAVFNAGLV